MTGIAPGPEKIETLVDAMLMAHSNINIRLLGEDQSPKERQYHAFRARILRMFEELEEEIEYLVEYGNR